MTNKVSFHVDTSHVSHNVFNPRLSKQEHFPFQPNSHPDFTLTLWNHTNHNRFHDVKEANGKDHMVTKVTLEARTVDNSPCRVGNFLKPLVLFPCVQNRTEVNKSEVNGPFCGTNAWPETRELEYQLRKGQLLKRGGNQDHGLSRFDIKKYVMNFVFYCDTYIAITSPIILGNSSYKWKAKIKIWLKIKLKLIY